MTRIQSNAFESIELNWFQISSLVSAFIIGEWSSKHSSMLGSFFGVGTTAFLTSTSSEDKRKKRDL